MDEVVISTWDVVLWFVGLVTVIRLAWKLLLWLVEPLWDRWDRWRWKKYERDQETAR